MRAPRPIPLGAVALILSGCLDFGFKPAVSEQGDDVVSDDAGMGPLCPSKAEACAERCGVIKLTGCEPYACKPCDPACIPTVTCESIQAQCGSLDTGCERVECANQCGDLSCLENHCCTAEPVAVSCRGLCGGSAANNCGDQVACGNPCGQHSAGCRDAMPPEAATCFCPHAYQGETCEEKQLPLVYPVDLAVDPEAGRAYVLDESLRAVLVVDLETGNRWTLSDGDDNGVARGIGRAFQKPRRIVLDMAHRYAFVTDMWQAAVVRVDLVHGHREFVSGPDNGSGPALQYPKGLVLDEANDVAYVNDADSLVEVRLTTGVRRVISRAVEGDDAATVGAGPVWRSIMDLAVDLPNKRAYVFGAEALLAVDLDTGDRTLLSTGLTLSTSAGTVRGEGPAFKAVTSGLLDIANNRAFVGDTQLNSVFAIDLETGDRTVLSTDADADGMPHGTGPALEMPFGMRLDQAGTGLLLVDTLLGVLGRVDIASGDRSWRIDGGVGAGPRLYEPTAIARDPLRPRAFVVDTEAWQVVEVDIASGERTTLAGKGVALKQPVDITIDGAGSYGYVADAQVGIVRIDLRSGLRHLVSDETDAALGPSLSGAESVALDEVRQQLIVGARAAKLIAVSLQTGARTMLSDSSHGSGPMFQQGSGLTFDQANHAVLLADWLARALFRVDVIDGTRTVISGQIPAGIVRGRGEMFDHIVDVALDPARPELAYVVDGSTSGVIAVNLATGDRTPISTVEGDTQMRHGTGIGFVSPEGLAFDSDGRFVLVDRGLGSVLSVDVATGDRTLVSRLTF